MAQMHSDPITTVRNVSAAVVIAPDVVVPDCEDPEDDEDAVDEPDPDPDDEVPVADDPDDAPVPVAVAVEKPEEAVLDAPSCPPGAPPLPGSAVWLPSVVDTAWAVGALSDSLLPLPPLPPLPPPPLPPLLPPLPGVGEAPEAGGDVASPPAAAAVVAGRTVVKLEVALTLTQLRS